MRIATKQQFLDMAARGLLGNQMPSWPTVAAAMAAGHRGTVMVRYKRPDSPYMRADVPIEAADAVIDGLVAQGAERPLLYLTHMTPGVGRLLNAECWRGPAGLYLNYSTAQTHLRAALDESGRPRRAPLGALPEQPRRPRRAARPVPGPRRRADRVRPAHRQPAGPEHRDLGSSGLLM